MRQDKKKKSKKENRSVEERRKIGKKGRGEENERNKEEEEGEEKERGKERRIEMRSVILNGIPPILYHDETDDIYLSTPTTTPSLLQLLDFILFIVYIY